MPIAKTMEIEEVGCKIQAEECGLDSAVNAIAVSSRACQQQKLVESRNEFSSSSPTNECL